jgi:hypothetical protein
MQKRETNLSLLKTLQFCFLMWDWLARHPTKTKSDYLKMIIKRVKNWPIGDCYVCEYMRTNDTEWSTDCGNCIFKGLWPKGCSASLSVYKDWSSRYSSTTKKRIAARKIANYCIARIKNISH